MFTARHAVGEVTLIPQVAIMRIAVLCRAALVLLFILKPTLSCTWGSLSPAQTHQYIISTAYARLAADPAFARDVFPALKGIAAYEGVEWTVEGLVGVGPDAKGMSPYSDHYYNPVTKDGNGPNAAAEQFTALARQNVAGTIATGKAAAWSAHFLADMFVPFHVTGVPRGQAAKIWADQTARHPGEINLGHSVIGSYALSYATPFKGGSRNFHTELSRFITKTTPAEADWFDAWYYNGNTDAMMVKSSSHVAWEAAPRHSMSGPGIMMSEFHRRAGSGSPGYVPGWRNAAPAFTTPWDNQAGRVRELAVSAATQTRKQLDAYVDDPTPALSEAVRTVTSMWRSSFSGLRPAIEYAADGPNRYRVTANIGNRASAAVSSVQARLSTRGCSVSGEAVQTVNGSIAAGGGMSTRGWSVATADTPCRLTLEVIGTYPIPDLQYASVTRTLQPPPARPSKPDAGAPPPAAAPPRTPSPTAKAAGAWVFEKTDFVVEKVDADFMAQKRPAESGSDGAGSAEATFGHPDPKVNTVRVKMKLTWTPPPRVLIPGSPVEFTVTVSDAGSDDPRGLGVGGVGSVGANCPALSDVWYGPAAGFDLKLGERTKTATKSYTPPKGRPGDELFVVADYGVFARRQQFIYRYRFSATGSADVPIPPATAKAPVEADVFDSMNIYGVGNQPTAPAVFALREARLITSIMTYHWNDGRGTRRTGTVALRDASGRTYGPWPVRGMPGQGGVPNASWTCTPNVTLPAGSYTIVDSEPATWSQNPQSGGRGMAVVRGAATR